MTAETLRTHPTAFFLDSGGSNLFVQLAAAPVSSQLREGVVICPPAPQEVRKTHWMQRQIALRLQQAGYTTLRFDYTGTGDSEGPSAAFDLDLCQQNIRDVIRHLKNSGLVRRITVVALRLSCPLLLRVSQSERVKRVVLIDPVFDGQAYLDTLKALHSSFVSSHPYQAPFIDRGLSPSQSMGFPLDAALCLQLSAITPTPPQGLKVKSLHLLQSDAMPPLDAWLAALSRGEPTLDELRLSRVSENLRWDHAPSLSIQDFPNQLINAVVDAVRGQS